MCITSTAVRQSVGSATGQCFNVIYKYLVPGECEVGWKPNSAKYGCSSALPAEIRSSELNTNNF